MGSEANIKEEVKPSEAVSGDESMDEEEEGGGGISDSELDFLKLEQGDLSPVKKSRRRSSAVKNEDDNIKEEVEPSSEEKKEEEPKSKAKGKKRSPQEKAALPK